MWNTCVVANEENVSGRSERRDVLSTLKMPGVFAWSIDKTDSTCILSATDGCNYNKFFSKNVTGFLTYRGKHDELRNGPNELRLINATVLDHKNKLRI